MGGVEAPHESVGVDWRSFRIYKVMTYMLLQSAIYPHVYRILNKVLNASAYRIGLIQREQKKTTQNILRVLKCDMQ